MKTRLHSLIVALPLLSAMVWGCDRAAVWDRPLGVGDSVAVQGAVIWPVTGREELALYRPGADVISFEALSAAPTQVLVTEDKAGALALDDAGGVTALRFKADGQLDRRTDYDLGQPFSNVVLSADGRFAVFHHGDGASGSAIVNPNEIAILDLNSPAGDANPVRRTLRSFGAGLRSVVLSGPGEIGGAERRLAWALSDRYLALFDLNAPTADEVVVHFTLPADTREVVPTRVQPVPSASGGPPGALVQAAGTADLFLLSFPADAAPNIVPKPTMEVLPAGSGASDVLPVITPAGLRIMALNGHSISAIDPVTGNRKDTPLPVYATQFVPYTGADGAHQALLWNPGQGAVVFARLDEVEQARGRALETLALEGSIEQLLPVPNEARAVAVQSNRLAILDFEARGATPFDLGGSFASNDYSDPYSDGPAYSPEIALSSDGRQVFALVWGDSPTLVDIDLHTGTPGSVPLPAGGRMLIVPGSRSVVIDHRDQAGDVTVLPQGPLDAEKTSVETHEDLFFSEVLDR